MFNPDFNLDVPTGARYFPSAGSPTSSRQRPDRRHRGVEEGFRRMNGRGRGERTRSPTFGTHRHHPDHEENHHGMALLHGSGVVLTQAFATTTVMLNAA